MKIYVSASDKLAARHVARVLEEAGASVVSTWHARSGSGEFDIDRNFEEIDDCDYLVTIAHWDYVPGSRFVEVGYALGRDKPVVSMGDPENSAMRSALVTQLDRDDLDEMLYTLGLLDADQSETPTTAFAPRGPGSADPASPTVPAGSVTVQSPLRWGWLTPWRRPGGR